MTSDSAPGHETETLRAQSLWPRLGTWLAIALLCGLRFCFLSADFPNDSPWMSDQAKFTDEGWWASAAVSHHLTGHWNVPGDYNPAAALPVWPLLLDGLFDITGVSVVAARALSVAFSIAAMGLVFLLARRFSGGRTGGATLAVLLLAASPFGFVFSRLAILESLVGFEFCLALTLASLPRRGRFWPWVLLPFPIAAMVLTKTTAAVLVPAVLWLAASAMHETGRIGWGKRAVHLTRALVACAVIPAMLVKGYAYLVAASRYGEDFRYFFEVNAYSQMEWNAVWRFFLELLRNGFWIDRVVYPAALAALALSVGWKRALWRNPLYTACWIAFAAQAAFIVSRQDDYAPRYFLWLLMPLVLATVFAMEAIAKGSRIGWAVRGLTIVAAVAWNAATLASFMAHRSYGMSNAADSIRRIVLADRRQNPLLVGVSGSELSLMTGIPSINDAYGTEDMALKLRRYKPGWCVAWNGAIDSDVTSLFDMNKVASYSIFDDDDRNTLILYQLAPKTSAPRYQ